MSLLPWHLGSARAAEASIASDRVPQGWLVVGTEGWGEREFGNWLALRLLDLAVELDASVLAHPDLLWAVPEGALHRVDAIRALVEFAQGGPQVAPRKVIVLEQAHAMNRNAANALLKTLEEPPSGVHLLLLTSRPGQLLATVRSRCQRSVLPIDGASGVAWLTAQLPDVDVESLLFEQGGAPLAVLEAHANARGPIAEALDGALRGAGVKELSERWANEGLADVTGRWLRYVQDALAGGRRLPALDPVPARRLAMFAQELQWIRRQLLASNSVNERLMAERLLDGWRDLLKA
ncbi:MAG TPA: hypothetical protein DCR65_02065 [Gammaproteobacteria bacterium]|jgi:DNA polymerase-3 subunit delta'|nr:hypothetical protein [Gammaproteobacteria bacterium]